VTARAVSWVDVGGDLEIGVDEVDTDQGRSKDLPIRMWRILM
jgi:hypothetical protein